MATRSLRKTGSSNVSAKTADGADGADGADSEKPRRSSRPATPTSNATSPVNASSPASSPVRHQQRRADVYALLTQDEEEEARACKKTRQDQRPRTSGRNKNKNERYLWRNDSSFGRTAAEASHESENDAPATTPAQSAPTTTAPVDGPPSKPTLPSVDEISKDIDAEIQGIEQYVKDLQQAGGTALAPNGSYWGRGSGGAGTSAHASQGLSTSATVSHARESDAWRQIPGIRRVCESSLDEKALLQDTIKKSTAYSSTASTISHLSDMVTSTMRPYFNSIQGQKARMIMVRQEQGVLGTRAITQTYRNTSTQTERAASEPATPAPSSIKSVHGLSSQIQQGQSRLDGSTRRPPYSGDDSN